MDGSAYVEKSQWRGLMDELGVTQVQLRDQRYDAVLHLVTAADGAEKFYDNKDGGTLICADNANILLNATNDDTTNSVLNYMITTCDYQQNLNAKINLQCKSYEEVQQYLKDFMLEMRIIYQ